MQIKDEKRKSVLSEMLEETGLEKSKSDILVNNFSEYFKIVSEWEAKAKKIVITDVSQVEEMKLAREGRLFLRDKRVLVEKTRKELKESSLREGQAIDSIAKMLTKLISPIENDLELKEKFKEIKEMEEKDKIRQERRKIVADYSEFIPINIDLADLTDVAFNTILTGAKSQYEDKLQEQKRLEEEKEEQKRIATLDNQRKNEIRDLGLWDFLDGDIKKVNFANMTDKYYQGLKSDMSKIKIQKEEEFKKIREENELLKNELKVMASPAPPAVTKKDKTLKSWVDSFSLPESPVAKEVVIEIMDKFESFKKWSYKKIENL